MNTYRITLEKSTVLTKTTEIDVQADSEEDARVLAKYKDVPSWDWSSGESVERAPAICQIEIVHGVSA
jgi:hypothetical protein